MLVKHHPAPDPHGRPDRVVRRALLFCFLAPPAETIPVLPACVVPLGEVCVEGLVEVPSRAVVVHIGPQEVNGRKRPVPVQQLEGRHPLGARLRVHRVQCPTELLDPVLSPGLVAPQVEGIGQPFDPPFHRPRGAVMIGCPQPQSTPC